MELVGNEEFRAAAELAQRRSIVLLKNTETDSGTRLPLGGRPRLYVEGIDADTASQFGEVVDAPGNADFAIIRLQTPFEPRNTMLLEMFFPQGDLDFKGDEKARILAILNTVPTIVDINLQRAAVIPDIAAASAGLFASFGATDQVILDAVFGNFNPSGRMPIELPSSMAAVEAQLEDMPYDSENPLFEFDFGLSYEQ
jgi:beta-glucosidase